MTEKESREMTQSNYAAQMEMMGYDASGNSLDMIHVVRCRDCKHRPMDYREEYDEMTGFGLEFPDDYCPCQCEDGWYNWFPDDDWYCANGERRDDDALSGC